MLARVIVRGGNLIADGVAYECRIGREGLAADKCEGDLKTPIGSFAMRWCYYRPDKIEPPKTQLPVLVQT